LQLLSGVVVLSMALTPLLSALGDAAAERIAAAEPGDGGAADLGASEARKAGHGEGRGDVVVICGFGPVGQVLRDGRGGGGVRDRHLPVMYC
jgi:hypothetical protein